VVICGPTNPRRVKPVGDQVRTLQAELDCKNCYGKECDHHSCMSQVTPQMVVDVLADVLK
jgi:heptosyltransferase-2